MLVQVRIAPKVGERITALHARAKSDDPFAAKSDILRRVIAAGVAVVEGQCNQLHDTSHAAPGA